jgi:hypothetical protein
MKYIITESKINKFVSNYLDGQKWYTWDIGDGEFNVADEEYGKDVIHYRIQESITVPDRMFDLIYVDGMFVTRLSNLFGLEVVRDVNPLVVDLISILVAPHQCNATDIEYAKAYADLPVDALSLIRVAWACHGPGSSSSAVLSWWSLLRTWRSTKRTSSLA